MLKNDDWTRLTRFVAGECDAHEEVEIERWVANDPARLDALEDLRAAWELFAGPDGGVHRSGGGEPSSPPNERAFVQWLRLKRRLNEAADPEANEENEPRRVVRPDLERK